MNITRQMDNPIFDKLAEMVDPYGMIVPSSRRFCSSSFVVAYFDRYSKMKIFQLQGAGDEFFLPDSEVLSTFHFAYRMAKGSTFRWQDFFWNDLQAATGGSYLRYRLPRLYVITG